MSPTEHRKPGMSHSYYSFGPVSGLADPFTTISQPRSTSLNATASAFQPSPPTHKECREVNPAGGEAFGASYLQSVIDSNEPAPEQSTSWGTLTKDSGKSRTMKIACVHEGTSVQGFIKVSGGIPVS